MDKTFVGSRLEQMLPGLETKPISRVDLLDENGDLLATAGDDTGRTLEAVHPDATDAMALSILEQARGYVYRPYEGRDALVDPAAELGDGITAGGLYSVMAGMDITFDRLFTADIEAPVSDEIEDEYPYKSPLQRQIERNYQTTRSLITKTSTEIKLQVEDTKEQLGHTLRLTKDGLTVTNAKGEAVKISGGQIKAEELDASKIKAEELDASKIRAQDLNLTGCITFGDLDSAAQSTVNNAATLAQTAYGNAATAITKAGSALDGLALMANGKYQGGTFINGRDIYAPNLYGDTINLMDGQSRLVGTMSMVYDQTFAFDLASNLSLRLRALGGNAYIGSSTGAFLTLGQSGGTPICQLGGGALVTSSYSYGSVLPATGVQGQVFFLLGG